MQPISILVADDDEHIRQCVRRALEIDPELQVICEAENGLQALALAAQHHPDIVLLDAQMPRMDGFETARCIRQRCPGSRGRRLRDEGLWLQGTANRSAPRSE